MPAQIFGAIPALPPMPTPLAESEFPHLRKKSAARVLIVDDESLVRWSIAETLRARGFHIVEAADARSALQAVDDSAALPDAVLLDLKLPDSSDLRLLAAIRRSLPAVPVILMTAFGTADVFEEARRLGVFCVLDKPFELSEVDALVEQAIRNPQFE